ncbi:MAG: DUF1549 domain-containing protein, partial [Planctomycetaceae bacterium]|nr:DUF1549 domain-containing protein [Planctomycetaceae bacterium]
MPLTRKTITLRTITLRTITLRTITLILSVICCPALPCKAVAAESATGVSESEQIDFDTQVMPILTKAGCNAGSCHGAAAGRGGFHLSLYGSRPADDIVSIAHEFEGRRIQRTRPARSLLLLKPTENLSHEGGSRLTEDGRDYQVLQQWIEQGAVRRGLRRLQSLTTELRPLPDAETTSDPGQNGPANHGSPAESPNSDSRPADNDFAADAAMATVQFLATAVFSDGSTANVLPWTIITPEDPTAVSVSESGVVRAFRPGRHLLTARYLDRVRSLELMVPFPDFNNRQHAAGAEQQREAMSESVPHEGTWIDDFIERRLRQLNLPMAGTCDDYTFLRRITLDLTGRLPTTNAIEDFTSDPAADKRQQLIDRLTTFEEVVAYQTFLTARRFRIGQIRSNTGAARRYFDWLNTGVREDSSWAQTAREALAAVGAADEFGPVSFYNAVGDARAQTEFFGQVFLGVRLQCANCHDHPLDQWTQDDYHGVAAVFARVKRGAVVQFSDYGETIHPATGAPAIPRLPMQDKPPAADDPRHDLAEWLAQPANPWFARAAVNRLWTQFMGRGLIEPADDLRITNPATHPELLEKLAAVFVKHGYRRIPVIRLICRSRAYQRDAFIPQTPDALPQEFYSTAISRPLSPAVYADAVADVTSANADTESVRPRHVSFEGLVSEDLSAPLQSLGACETQCESPAIDRDRLSVRLHLLNGRLLNDAVRKPTGIIAQLTQKSAA